MSVDTNLKEEVTQHVRLSSPTSRQSMNENKSDRKYSTPDSDTGKNHRWSHEFITLEESHLPSISRVALQHALGQSSTARTRPSLPSRECSARTQRSRIATPSARQTSTDHGDSYPLQSAHYPSNNRKGSSSKSPVQWARKVDQNNDISTSYNGLVKERINTTTVKEGGPSPIGNHSSRVSSYSKHAASSVHTFSSQSHHRRRSISGVKIDTRYQHIHEKKNKNSDHSDNHHHLTRTHCVSEHQQLPLRPRYTVDQPTSGIVLV